MSYVEKILVPGEKIVHRADIWLSFTELVITNRRVICKRGLLGRRIQEIYRDKIEGVDVRQGLLDRLNGFGTVTFRGTGIGY